MQNQAPVAGQTARPTFYLTQRGWAVVIGIVLLLVVAGITSGVSALRGKSAHVVPAVNGLTLAGAKNILEGAGVDYAYNEDQRMFGIIDESNWYVCGETPSPGTKTKSTVWLDVRHWNC